MSIYKISYNSDTMSWDHQFPIVLQNPPYGISPQTYASTLHTCEQIMYEPLKAMGRRRKIALVLATVLPTLVFTPLIVLAILGLVWYIKMPFLVPPTLIGVSLAMLVSILLPFHLLKRYNQQSHRKIKDELFNFLAHQNATVFGPSNLQLILKDYDTEKGFGNFCAYGGSSNANVIVSSGPVIELLAISSPAFQSQPPQVLVPNPLPTYQQPHQQLIYPKQDSALPTHPAPQFYSLSAEQYQRQD